MILTIGLLAITAFSAWKWAQYRIIAMIYLWYLTEKNYPLPTDQDMARGRKWVVGHILKDLGI